MLSWRKSRGGFLAKPKKVSGVFAVREGYWLSTSKGGFESPIPRGQTAATVKATPSMILAGVMKRSSVVRLVDQDTL